MTARLGRCGIHAPSSEGVSWRKLGFAALSIPIVFAGMANADSEPLRIGELMDLGLEELVQLDVISVSKIARPWFGAAAAVYVLTSDDIRRSGARSIAEALRMVPGMNVAQLDNNKWAISARGFNHLYAHHLLVLLDGRSVYSPLHSGVHWDTIDTVLDDIDRIEVVRGPGAALWGANAVNGVINIITKKAEATQGNVVSIGVGNRELDTTFRHGGELGKGSFYRVYGKYSDLGANSRRVGSEAEANDDWRMGRTGFRTEWTRGAFDRYTLQGDVYRGMLGETLRFPDLSVPVLLNTTIATDMKVAGANLLGRWTRQHYNNSELVIQVFADHTSRRELDFFETHNTLDLDLQYSYRASARHMLMWGAGYRTIWDKTEPSFRYGFQHRSQHIDNSGVFIQDEITLTATTDLTAGVKFEHFNYTGWESQPSLRFAWSPTLSQTLWAAVSRAARTPSRNDTDARINAAAFMQNGSTPTVVRILGNPDISSEHVTAYELGLRLTHYDDLYIDVALFRNRYEDLTGTQPETPQFEATPAPNHLVLPRRFVSDTNGHTQGAELAASWWIQSAARLNLSYAYLDMDITSPDQFDISGNSPQHVANVRFDYDWSATWQTQLAAYYVDKLVVQNRTQPVNDYTRIDLTGLWRPRSGLRFMAGVRNAFDPRHQEFGSLPFVVASEVDRTYFVDVTTQF